MPRGIQWATYGSAGDSQLDLAPSSAHQLAELMADALQETQSVVLGEGGEEVLDGVGLVLPAGVLLELGNDGGFVLGGEGWRKHDLGQLWVSAVDVVEGTEGLGDRVERLRLHCCGVLVSVSLAPHAVRYPPLAHGEQFWRYGGMQLTYQSTGIGAIEAVEGHGWLRIDTGWGCVAADGRQSDSSGGECRACCGGASCTNEGPGNVHFDDCESMPAWRRE